VEVARSTLLQLQRQDVDPQAAWAAKTRIVKMVQAVQKQSPKFEKGGSRETACGSQTLSNINNQPFKCTCTVKKDRFDSFTSTRKKEQRK
jgi:hypothetical protein